MNKFKFAVLSVFLSMLFAVACQASDFSADLVSKAQGKTVQGKVFMGNNKMRMETQEGVTITRMDKKTVWILMPKEKMYMERALDASRAPAQSEKVEGEVKRALVGQDVIDGRKVEKYEVVYVNNNKKESMFQWIVPGMMMPVKMAAGDNSWSMEYKNIKTGKQDDSLFEIQAGYEKFSMQMPSMKNMFKK